MEKQDNQQSTMESVWGTKEAANIISGTIAFPFCIQYLSLSENDAENANALNQLAKSLYEHQMFEEVLLLLKILNDLIGMEFPSELAAALEDAIAYRFIVLYN